MLAVDEKNASDLQLNLLLAMMRPEEVVEGSASGPCVPCSWPEDPMDYKVGVG